MPEASASINQLRQRKVKGRRRRITLYVTAEQYDELEQVVEQSGGSISSVATYRYKLGCDVLQKTAGITPKFTGLNINSIGFVTAERAKQI